jgi:hypothetical protein
MTFIIAGQGFVLWKGGKERMKEKWHKGYGVEWILKYRSKSYLLYEWKQSQH